MQEDKCLTPRKYWLELTTSLSFLFRVLVTEDGIYNVFDNKIRSFWMQFGSGVFIHVFINNVLKILAADLKFCVPGQE